MNALGNFLIMSSLVGFIVGAVAVVRPIQSLGLSRRRDGLFVMAASFVIMILGGSQVSPEPRQNAAASASTTPAAERPVSRAEALQNLTIGGFSWQKDGFGSVMMATFVIYNGNKFAVKDIAVTCARSANSGTKIDSNARTVYERIEAGSYQSVVKMNMGFIHSAASSSACNVTGFSRA
ncbi:MAG: hypothetical protein QOJ96_206 [Alphaproteobacteria bacterium]|jgi:hypothetical protein|nr:hypothetical protein [Alphaproteobacteria bacterium]